MGACFPRDVLMAQPVSGLACTAVVKATSRAAIHAAIHVNHLNTASPNTHTSSHVRPNVPAYTTALTPTRLTTRLTTRLNTAGTHHPTLGSSGPPPITPVALTPDSPHPSTFPHTTTTTSAPRPTRPLPYCNAPKGKAPADTPAQSHRTQTSPRTSVLPSSPVQRRAPTHR